MKTDLILVIISVTIFLPWAFLSFKMFSSDQLKQLRGIVKFLTNDEYQEYMRRLIIRWLLASGAVSLLPCIWIMKLTWATDYSFLIGLFPLIWYYFLFRFLFWEKHDLN